MHRKHVFCLLATMAILGPALLPSLQPASATRPTITANVLVFSRTASSPLVTSLGIDSAAIDMTVLVNTTVITMNETQFNDTLAAADVFFVDRYLPADPAFLILLASHVNGTLGNTGLIMFGLMEGDLDATQVSIVAPLLPVILQAGFVNSTRDSTVPGYSIQVKVNPDHDGSSSVLLRGIPWVSAPMIDRRTVVVPRTPANGIIVDLAGQHAIVAGWQLGGGTGARVLLFSAEINQHNIGFSVWPYFNFLMYACTFHALHGYDEALIESFQQWPWSPLPDLATISGWFIMIAGLWVITFACFFKYKKEWNRRKAELDVPPAPVVKEVLSDA